MNKKQLKAVFANVLLPSGYTNVKDMFFRRIGDVFTIVDLDKSRFGGDFTIRIGLFADESNLTQPPPFHLTHLKKSLTAIVPQPVGDNLLLALDLEAPMKDNKRSTIITDALKRYGLPYLDLLSTIDKIADYLSPEKRNFAGVTLALREIISRRTGRDFSI